MPPDFTHILLFAIISLSILLMLVRPRGIAEAWWICGGSASLLLFRLVPLKLAAHAVAQGTDVYLFLLGMMLLSALARFHGVFDWVSSTAVGHAKGSCARLFLLIYIVGTVVTIFMSNDATAVVLTPAILAAVRKAKVSPLPYLFICAFIANAASFVLPISNPANLVVYRTGMPPLSHWLNSFGIPSACSILATYAVMRLVFRKELRQTIMCEVQSVALTAEGKLVLAGIGATSVVLMVASAFRLDLGLPTCVAALLVAAAVSIKTRSLPGELLGEISWSTLILVAGLYVLVNAAESQGALRFTAEWLAQAQQLRPAAAATLAAFTVGVGNNLINNLPLALIVGNAVHILHLKGLLANSVLIGIDLGPNLSVTGSLATILWLIALRKEGLDVSFWKFLRVGAIAMPIALVAALAGAVVSSRL
jgi:arsenical pump membrane protein